MVLENTIVLINKGVFGCSQFYSFENYVILKTIVFFGVLETPPPTSFFSTEKQRAMCALRFLSRAPELRPSRRIFYFAHSPTAREN